MRTVPALVVCAGAIVAGACQFAHDLLPRTHTTSTSPDGRTRAFVRQHLNFDPPNDHLYLIPTEQRPRHLMALAPDSDWCRTIIWTSDSRKIGFLIRDQRLAIFNSSTGELEAMLVLVKADGYPGTQAARQVAFNADGSAVSFERFERPTMTRKTRASTPDRGRSLGREELEVPTEIGGAPVQIAVS